MRIETYEPMRVECWQNVEMLWNTEVAMVFGHMQVVDRLRDMFRRMRLLIESRRSPQDSVEPRLRDESRQFSTP